MTNITNNDADSNTLAKSINDNINKKFEEQNKRFYNIEKDISEIKDDISKLKISVETLEIQRQARNAYLASGVSAPFNDYGAGFQRRDSVNATRAEPEARRLWIG